MRGFLIVACIFASAISARAESLPRGPHPGDVFNVTRDIESSDQGDNGSTGTSTDIDTFVERVIAANDAGWELEYDLPKSAKKEARADDWQLPARVFELVHGPLELRNRAELETRVTSWLKRANLPRTACGHWYFTWTAFQVECDPQSVLRMIEAFDLDGPELHAGDLYKDANALTPAPLHLKSLGSDGSVFGAELTVDPNVARKSRAANDLVVAEILHKPLSLDEALRKRSAEDVSGTITITFETDSTGIVRKRTKVTKTITKAQNGRSGTRTVTETVERRLVSRTHP